MKQTDLIIALAGITDNDLPITIYSENGFVFKSNKNTGVFESTNCLELDDPNYLEYYACCVEVTEIVTLTWNTANEKTEQFNIGDFIELSEINEPIKIETESKKVIWQR